MPKAKLQPQSSSGFDNGLLSIGQFVTYLPNTAGGINPNIAGIYVFQVHHIPCIKKNVR